MKPEGCTSMYWRLRWWWRLRRAAGGALVLLHVVLRDAVWYISMAYLPLPVLFLARVSCIFCYTCLFDCCCRLLYTANVFYLRFTCKQSRDRKYQHHSSNNSGSWVVPTWISDTVKTQIIYVLYINLTPCTILRSFH